MRGVGKGVFYSGERDFGGIDGGGGGEAHGMAGERGHWEQGEIGLRMEERDW